MISHFFKKSIETVTFLKEFPVWFAVTNWSMLIITIPY